MNYTCREIIGGEQDQFYTAFTGEKTFLQTSKYGEWRGAVGEQNFRIGIFHDTEMVGVCQFQLISARRGKYLHVPHGPLIHQDYTVPGMETFFQYYIQTGEKQKCDFVRMSPLLLPEFSDLFASHYFRPAPVHLVNPEKTWVLDITRSEEEILAQMKKSTRYEVRRIDRENIRTRMGNEKEDLDIFWDLHTQTVQRQHFVPFPRSNTEKELELFGADIQVFSASIDQKYYSSSIIWFDSHAAYYHQGASVYSKLPVAHATIWAAIREAKKRGCKEFNFWGVSDAEDTKHPWYGLSRFKRGFGGEERDYLHAQDYPLTSKYWLNFAVERWRRWRRGY